MISSNDDIWYNDKAEPPWHPRRWRRRRTGMDRLAAFAKLTGEDKFPERYLRMIFESKLAQKGGPVRRNRACVEKYLTVEDLLVAGRACGFRAIEIGDQILLFSNILGVRNL